MKIIGKLVAMRARQLQYRDKNLEKAALNLQCFKEQDKEEFDFQKRLQTKELNIRDLVLLYNIKLKF